LKGLISNTVITKLSQLTTKSIATKAMTKFVIIFHQAFKEHVWIPKCKNLIKFEQSLGITDTHKRNTQTSSRDLRTSQYTHSTQQSRRDIINSGITRCINAVDLYIKKGFITGWKGIKSKLQN
jgi:hypothetical protein